MREPKRDAKDPEVERAAASWIAALREHESMPEQTRARLWERLETSIADVDDGPDAEVIALAPSSPRSALPWVGLALALATAAALALVFGGGGRLVPHGEGPIERVEAPFEGAPDSATQSVRERRPAAASASSVTSQREDPPIAASLEPERPRTTTRETSPRRPAARDVGRPSEAPGERAPSSTLAAETEALRRVRLELSKGEPARALELLEAHTRRVPDAVLVEERAALRVVALCAAGRVSEGEAAAARFLAGYPSSALAARVRAACPGA